MERGVLGENTNTMNWFVYATKQEGDKNRIIAAVSLCQKDYDSKESFFEALIDKKIEYSQKYGMENIGNGGANSFLDFVSSWNDEFVLGGGE